MCPEVPERHSDTVAPPAIRRDEQLQRGRRSPFVPAAVTLPAAVHLGPPLCGLFHQLLLDRVDQRHGTALQVADLDEAEGQPAAGPTACRPAGPRANGSPLRGSRRRRRNRPRPDAPGHCAGPRAPCRGAWAPRPAPAPAAWSIARVDARPTPTPARRPTADARSVPGQAHQVPAQDPSPRKPGPAGCFIAHLPDVLDLARYSLRPGLDEPPAVLLCVIHASHCIGGCRYRFRRFRNPGRSALRRRVPGRRGGVLDACCQHPSRHGRPGRQLPLQVVLPVCVASAS